MSIPHIVEYIKILFSQSHVLKLDVESMLTCSFILLWPNPTRFDGRYPHELLCVTDTPSIAMLWIRYTLWIPLYIMSVITEGEWISHSNPVEITVVQSKHSSDCISGLQCNWPAEQFKTAECVTCCCCVKEIVVVDRKWVGKAEAMIK